MTEKSQSNLDEDRKIDQLLKSPIWNQASNFEVRRRSISLREHTILVANMLNHLCEILGIPPNDKALLKRVAYFHDLGKMKVEYNGELRIGPLHHNLSARIASDFRLSEQELQFVKHHEQPFALFRGSQTGNNITSRTLLKILNKIALDDQKDDMGQLQRLGFLLVMFAYADRSGDRNQKSYEDRYKTANWFYRLYCETFPGHQKVNFRQIIENY